MKRAKMVKPIRYQRKRSDNQYHVTHLCKEIRNAFPWAALALAIPVYAVDAPSGDITMDYLNNGYYDLNLTGDVTWNSVFNINTVARNTITINGNGHTITAGMSRNRLLEIGVNSNITINNAIITNAPFNAGRQSMFRLANTGILVNLVLDGTTFRGIGPLNAGGNGDVNDYGPIISHRQTNSTLNIDGGTAGLLFQNNWGTNDQPGTIGIDYGTANFLGNITFDTNWTGNYGGAVTLYEHSNATMNFNGNTTFTNNHSSVHGGAINIYGNNSKAYFNGTTTFNGNYVYGIIGNSLDFPIHVTDQNGSGGAINIGYIETGTDSASATFTGTTLFTNNFVINTKNNATNNAFGGAISLQARGENRNYYLYINGLSTVFDGNFVYAVNGNGFGGAIYVDTNQSANINGGTTFTNNYAKTSGGAIYVRRGAINLNADNNDIVFQNNRQGATFTSYSRQLTNGAYTFYTPDADSGTPNAIYWAAANTLTLDGTSGYAIRFYDPIAIAGNATLTVNQSGTGETIFYGDNGATTNYDSILNVNTTINGGTFTLANGVNYGNTTQGTFVVNANGTLQGSNTGTLRAATINLNNASTLAVAGGTLLLNSAAIALGNTANSVVNLIGYGTLNSTSNLNAANAGTTLAANIGADASANPYALTLQAIVSGTTALTKTGVGTLIIPVAQAYSGNTAINQGTVIINADGTLSTGAVNIANAGTLSIESPNSGNYTFTNALSGSGLLQVGLTAPTNTFDFAASAGSAFTGTAALNNSTFSLSGNNTAALTNATLQLNGGNTTTVGAGVQTIGNTVINGGILRFSNLPTGYISTGALALNSGVIQVDSNISDVVAIPLLQQDDNSANQTLIAATSVTGQAANLTLQDLAGNPITNTQSNIVQGGNIVAVGNYNAGLIANNTGLYLGYLLTQINLLAGQTLTLDGDATTPAGANDMKALITGSGNLAINAANTIILNNAGNNYTGTTTANTGTLQLGSDNALGNTSLLTINAGATTDINGFTQTIGALGGAGNLNVNSGNLSVTNGGTFAGSVLGTAGSFNVSGGTLTLTGNNAYTGTTSIAAGAQLAIGNGGTTGSYAGNIANSGDVSFNRTDSAAYGGVISGTGTLSQNGIGTTILTGDNTYSGGTTISAGTLQIGNGGTTGSIVGNITDNGILTFNRSDSISYGGIISGTGSLNQNGTGTTTLTGTNTYSGGTNVNAGTLVVTGDGTLGTGNVNIANTTTLQITAPNSGNYAFANGLTGSGLLQVDLSAAANSFDFDAVTGSAFTGLVELNNSTFSLTGDNTTALTNATLQLNSGNTTTVGTGTQNVGNLTLNGGTVNFANLPGGIIATNALALNSGNISINPGNTVNPGSSLLLQDEGLDALLISANSLTGSAANLTLIDLAGNALTSETVGIVQGGNTVADGTYSYALNTNNNNLNVSYRLTQLALLAGQTLTLDGDATTPAGANDMKALITGSGNLAINAANTIILNNAGNNYTGTTTANTGTLQLGSDNALGNTSLLTIAASATTDIKGFSQTIGTLGGAGNLNVNSGNLSVTNGGTFAGTVLGTSGNFNVSGGTLTLTGNNAYTGATSVAAGAQLAIGNGGTTGSYAGNIANSGDVSFNRSDSTTYSGVISGTGTLSQNGTGTTILTGDNTYSGGTTISAGTLQIGNGGTTGSIVGNITDNGTLAFNRSDNINYGGVISGTGSLNQNGTGITTLTGDNTYSGGTTINAGTLQIGDGGTNGSIGGNITDNGTLTFNRSNTLTYGSVISGTGSLNQNGTGTTTLTGANTYSGGTNVNAGTLVVTGDGTLGTGNVNIANAAALQIAAPNSGNYIFANDLTGSGLLQVALSSAANSFDFSAVTGSAFTGTVALNNSTFNLSGNNTIALTNATLQLNGGNTTTVGAGTQTIGNLTVNGGILNFANLPTGTITTNALALNSGSVRITPTDVVNPAGSLLLQDEGLGMLLISANSLTGSAANLTLTDLAGNALTSETVGIVQGGNTVANGTYSYALNTNNDDLNVSYRLTQLALLAGQTLTLDGDATTPAGANDMKALITGSGNLAINAANTIILNNAGNNYTGTTTANTGTLQLGSDNALGNTNLLTIATGATTDINGFTQTIGTLGGAGNLNVNSGNLSVINGGTFAGTVLGTAGNFNVSGGTLTLTGNNAYTGVTTVAAGAQLAIGNGGTTGSYAGNIANSGDVSFNRSDSTTYGGVISGTGTLSQNGTGTTILTGDNTYSGGTTISAGTLQIGNGGTTGSIVGNITDNGTLDFNRSDSISYGGIISGTGILNQNGVGTTILSAANTYSGGTNVNAGTLQLTNASAIGSGNAAVAAGSALDLSFDNGNFANVVSGAGGSTVNVNGSNITLSGNNGGYSGLWNITGSANVSTEANLGSGNVALNGALAIMPTATAFTFANALTGNGVMNVTMANAADTFAFGPAVGNSFGGTVALNNSTFSLAGNNTAALTNATLQLNNGNTTNVGTGAQNIGNLTFNGGSLAFSGTIPPLTSPDGTVNVQNLTLNGGNIEINVPTDVSNPAPPTGINLLAQDDGNILAQLISAAGTISGSISNLILTDLSGNPINAAQTLAVSEGGTNVANATYNFGLTTGGNNDGVYFNYGLTQLDLISGQTLHLVPDAGASGNAATLTALVTGAGNVDVNASTAGGQTVTFNNVNNSYTGATTASGGTLALGSNNALGNTSLLTINAGATTDINGFSQTIGTLGGAGNLNVNNGNLSVANGGAFAGTILGTAGNFNVNGGTLTLTGNNAYTGATSVAAGTQLAIGSGGTTGSYAGNIANSGDVSFNRTDSTTYGGVISGTGTLSQNGTGTLTLTGDNTYSGDTVINTGTLQLGNGGTTGSVAGNIANNGALVFDRSNNLTFAQTVSGSGSVAQSGTGTLIVTGSLAQTGGTTVNAGTLQIGDGNANGNVSGNILNNSIVAFNRNDAYSFDGIMSGSGSLQQNGSGTTTLTAVNTYTGPTVVNNGILRLTGNGAIGSGAVTLGSTGNLLIDSPASGNYLFNNALNGNGQLIANLANKANAFDFGNNVGTAFNGTFSLNQGSFTLNGDNVSSLTNATLNLGPNGVATLNSDETIGNLSFSGGQLTTSISSPNTANILTVNYLNVDVPGVTGVPGVIDLNGSTLGSVTQPTGNLLLQGNIDGNNGIKIVAANSVSTVGKQLTLLLDGVQPSDQTYTITDGFGNNDVRATYGYAAVATDNQAGDVGLYAGYMLKILDSQSNVVLDSTGAPNTSFDVKLTGVGNFEFRANNDSITLVNGTNDYSGETQVSSGTLRAGTDNALGQTSALNIASAANVDLNGFTQTIGALNTATGSTLNLNNGDLTITNGGVSDGNLTGGGQLTVAGGTLAINNANAGLTAPTAINNGATVQLANTAGLGSGNVNVNGTLDFNNVSGAFANTLGGNGTTMLTNGSNVYLAGNNSAYNGIIDIDPGNTLIAGEAANLGNSVIANNGNLELNTADSWTFTNIMSGSGILTKAGTGTISIDSDYAHTGGTTVQAGTLALQSDSAALSGGGPVTIANGATLGGYGSINGDVTNLGTLAVGNALALLTGGRGNLTIQGNMFNRGDIVLAGQTVGNTLTINGNYDAGSNLFINTVLGDDNSLTDKLIITGNTSGQTNVSVNNVGGTGAQTHNGIQIVDVGGESNGIFSLLGRVVAGAYDYSLYQGSVDDPNDGNWYLRTPEIVTEPEPEPEPEPGPGPFKPIRPEVGAYLANQDAAINMFVHSLHDRFGDSQFIRGNPAEGEPTTWGRIIGNYTDRRAADQIKQKTWGTTIQLGGDIYRNNAEQNSVNVGLMAGYGTARSKNRSDYQAFVAHSDLRGYSVGLYGTWFANGNEGSEGAYVDVWTQYGWYHNEVKGDQLAEETYRSRTFASSIEGGWTFKVSENESSSVFVQPQTQVIYAYYNGNDLREENGTYVQNNNNGGVITRVGVRLFGKHKTESQQRWQPFVETNWLYNDTAARISMNGEIFDSGTAKNRIELKTGVEGQINNDWQLWGNVGVQKGENSYKSAQGIVGVKYTW